MKFFRRKEEKNIFKKIFRKRSRLEKFYDRNKEFLKYSLISVICTIILYIIFYIVNKITNGDYFLANFLSYFISFTVLFFMNQRLFKSKPIRRRDKFRQVTSFVVVRVIGFPLDSYVLYLLINNFDMDNMTAKIIGSLIMFIYNYLTNKLFVFKKNNFI